MAQVLLNMQYMAAAQGQPLQHVRLLHGDDTHSLSMSCCKAPLRIILLESWPCQILSLVDRGKIRRVWGDDSDNYPCAGAF